MAVIEVRNLSFQYSEGQEQVIKEISFSIAEGTVTGIIGLSGCGKTTLCHCICGISPTFVEGTMTGDILIDGKDIRMVELSTLAKTLGFVMQDPDQQLVTTCVEDELAFAPENMGVPPEEICRRVKNVTELLGIGDLLYRNPGSLSGGQKHLVAIGSVLTLEPKIVVLDEPLSHLDRSGRTLVIEGLKRLRQEGRTVLVVEHNYKMLDFVDQWIVMLNGKISAICQPQDLLNDCHSLFEKLGIWEGIVCPSQ